MSTAFTATLEVTPVEFTATLSTAPVAIAAHLALLNGRDGADGAPGVMAPLATVPRGEAISAARAVYLADDGGTVKAYLASALDPTKAAQGFVKTAGAEGEAVEVWESGPLTGLAGIVPGAPYYLGANGQFVTVLPGSLAVYQRIGTGVSATEIGGRIESPHLRIWEILP